MKMLRVYHALYSCRRLDDTWKTVYEGGKIESIELFFSTETDMTSVTVEFKNGTSSVWQTKWLTSYMGVHGVPVSADGRYVFAPTWENGLYCLDARTGTVIWKTRSRRGVTSVFVHDNMVLCHQREHALQLLDIHTGEVLAEKRPATAFSFYSIDHGHIVCQVTARRWEILDARTLEVKAVFTHKEFTNGHTDYVVNQMIYTKNGILKICGFKNVWDNTVCPPRRLPNLEFIHEIPISL